MNYLVFLIDVNECLSFPCENGGSCTDEVNGYSCQCQPGYFGDQCHTGKGILYLIQSLKPT